MQSAGEDGGDRLAALSRGEVVDRLRHGCVSGSRSCLVTYPGTVGCVAVIRRESEAPDQEGIGEIARPGAALRR